MKTWNIWKSEKENTGPTGPWKFLYEVKAVSRDEALMAVDQMEGAGTFEAYEAIS